MREIERQQRERLQQAFSVLSLGERQLLLLGLWVIGEENRVDPRLEYNFTVLLQALGVCPTVTTDTSPAVPYVTGPLTPNAFATVEKGAD